MNSEAKLTIARQRARLVARCACEILGMADVPAAREVRLNMSVAEFEREFIRRYGATHPRLVYRTDSTVERARLSREPTWTIPKVILRQGAPIRRIAAAAGANVA